MDVLVVGASGLVGYEFFRQKGREKGWSFTYRSMKVDGFIRLEATDPAQVERVVSELKPELVILPAAMADVNRCEREYDVAYLNNVGIVKNFISALKKAGIPGARIVFISTDYLFDGKAGPYSEEAEPNPINKYGKLKLMCEDELRNSGLGYLIIRTTGIFGWEMQRKNFLYRVMDTLGAGKELVIPNDQYANPTYVKDLVGATLRLLELRKNGVFNVVGPQYMNRVELAGKFAHEFGLDGRKGLIKGVATSELGGLAPRPLKAGLKTGKIDALGIRVRTVEEAAADMRKSREKEDRSS